VIVLAGEEQRRSLPGEVLLEGRRLAVELRGQLSIGRLLDELESGEEVVGPLLETSPQLDFRTKAIRLAQDLLSRSLVVPESGFARQRLELLGARVLRPEVKGAPRSTGPAPPGREWWTRPLVPGLEILEQDRTELDQSEGRLAPGDDGVHAGTVAVVGTDAAIAITIERRRVAARAAIALAGDQIDERSFLGLLHVSLSPLGQSLTWALGCSGASADGS
jgi:hypothetical protein